MIRSTLIGLAACLSLITLPAAAGVIAVPADFTTIQAAIDHAAPGDDIEIDAGFYDETLVVRNASLRLMGAGRGQTIVHSEQGEGETPLITIDGASVTLVDLDLSGGGLAVGGLSRESRHGILATRSSLTLERVNMGRYFNYFVRVEHGALTALDVTLEDSSGGLACDLGFDLVYSDATILRLLVPTGFIDHVVMVNGTARPPEWPGYRSQIFLEGSDIALCTRSWGDGISLQHNAEAEIRHNTFVRDPNAVMPSVSKAVGVAGYSITARIVENRIDNAAIGVFVNGGNTDNEVLLEYNELYETRDIGVAVYNMNSEVVDLGGGRFGSQGRNIFCRNATPGRGYDVKYTSWGLADVFALDNTWSTREPAVAIWDVHDDPLDGEVSFGGPGFYRWNTCAP